MNYEDLEIMLDKELEEMLLLEALEDNVDNELSEKKQVSSNKKKRKKYTRKRLKEALKIRTVIILLLTLLVNTYAWFIYISTVSTGLNIHVKSWEFEFSVQDNTDDIVIFSDDLYPGMNEVKRSITATNKGETSANLSYVITSVKIFGTDLLEGKEAVNEEEFKELLKEYPFDIQVKMLSEDGNPYDPSNPMQENDKVQIEFTLNWVYEMKDAEGNVIEEIDQKDTQIGKEAYNYYHPKDENGVEIELTEEEKAQRSNAIEIIVHIEATQTKPNTEEPTTPMEPENLTESEV